MFGGTDTNYVTVRRNRIDYAGSGAIAWMWGVGNVAELNRISHSGMLIIDNEGIQVLRHGKAATSRQHSRFSLALFHGTAQLSSSHSHRAARCRATPRSASTGCVTRAACTH
tara:strand:+ start:81 stop:416 length:336 start_codon:yes stop_codon:yes gene_type:complete